MSAPEIRLEDRSRIADIDPDIVPWDGKLISADSHVVEPAEVWSGLLPADYWPAESGSMRLFKGGSDPLERLEMMDTDDLAAEVLYPTLGLKLFAIDDQQLHEACCRRYNEWLIDYCSADRQRLLGVGMIPLYDQARAEEEVHFCHEAGFKGLLFWQTPPPNIPFTGDHYEKVWSLAGRLDMPVSFHILTGFNYSTAVHGMGAPLEPLEFYRGAVNKKLAVAADALFDLIVGGPLGRHPDVKIVLVENEVSWIPFFIDQWDYYYRRFEGAGNLPIHESPSAIFARQVFITFFRDPMVSHLFNFWGADNCMWSNDYPHPVSTWPYSRQFVTRQFELLSEDVQAKLAYENVEALYHLT